MQYTPSDGETKMDLSKAQLEAINWAIEYTIEGIEEHSDFDEDSERNEIHTQLQEINRIMDKGAEMVAHLRRREV